MQASFVLTLHDYMKFLGGLGTQPPRGPTTLQLRSGNLVGHFLIGLETLRFLHPVGRRIQQPPRELVLSSSHWEKISLEKIWLQDLEIFIFPLDSIEFEYWRLELILLGEEVVDLI